jgi:hypothetical protein
VVAVEQLVLAQIRALAEMAVVEPGGSMAHLQLLEPPILAVEAEAGVNTAYTAKPATAALES